MNPLLNPLTGIPLIKHHIFDTNRLNRSSIEKVEKYKDKSFRKIVNYAYTIPLYHKKYKEAGINPKDIRGLKDITKLPFITKKDFVDNFPNGIIPPNYNKKNALVVSTSGSTGKPVSLYTDFSVISGGIGAVMRVLKSHGLTYKCRYANIGNFSPGKADDVAYNLFYKHLSILPSKDNRIKVNAFQSMKDIIEILDKFRPDLMVSYPITYQQLAYYKNKGYGENINPKVLAVSGYMLDEYTRSYVEEAFNCPMYNGYGSAESSSEAAIAFECSKKIWHINHDFFHVETIDENMNIVDPGKIGHIVVTRFFGKATPLIRYTGMDDWVTIGEEYDCSCGLCTPVFKNGVEGRLNTSVYLPDGRIFPSASFAILSVVLKDLKTRKVKQFQIVQKKLDEIEILIVIDDDLREKEPSINVLFKKIKEIYQEKVGPSVKITVKEVKEIKSEPNKPAPLVISHLTDKDRESVMN